MKHYKIFISDKGKFAFSFGKWGFYNQGFTGKTQPIIDDPNNRMVILFDSEGEARFEAERVTQGCDTKWKEI